MSRLQPILKRYSRDEVEDYFRDRSRSVYAGGDLILCRIMGHLNAYVHGSYVGMAGSLAFEGFWEIWLTRWFARVLNAGDHVLDVGANHGYFSMLAAEIVGSSGHVTSFEPNPAVFKCLKMSMQANGFNGYSTLHNAALADEEGTRPFFLHDDEPCNGGFIPSDVTREMIEDRGKIINVRTRMVKASDFERLDLIKIDVEGAELDVLRGLKDVIETHRPRIVCEVNLGRPYSFDDVFALLADQDQLWALGVDSAVRPMSREEAEGRIGEDLLIVWPSPE